MTRLALATALLLVASAPAAQPLPQGRFRNPLDNDIGLSATFAEFRTNHFHAGIDMRTGGTEGHAVHAADDGYVARVSISPWGGGKILYIKHDGGYTSVYMHLRSYAGAIGQAVLREQYARQSYSISKIFAEGELPVKKGQVVAYSGNTGGSGGPHLHFELRKGGEADLHTHATTINPLLFGLPYRDSVKPTLRGVRVYPVGGAPYSPGADGTIKADRPFYIGVYATDAAEGSTPNNGPDRVEVFLDGTPFFTYTTEYFPLDSSRMVNALLDWPHYKSTRQPYLLTRSLPGAAGPWVTTQTGDGIFRLKPGTTHSIGIRVSDIAGNTAERVLTVHVASMATQTVAARRAPDAYDRPYTFDNGAMRVEMEPLTLYADDSMRCQSSGGTFTVEPTVNNIPPHKSYTLALRGSLPGVPAGKTVVAGVTGKPGSERLTAYKTTHADGVHTAQVREWGCFTLAADTTAPTVRPLNFAEGRPLKTTTLRVRIADNLAGIESYSCTLNGQWILAEYDGKTANLAIDTAGKLRQGRNTLCVEVSDGAGNSSVRSWTLMR